MRYKFSSLILLFYLFIHNPTLAADELTITYEVNETNNDVVFKFQMSIPGSVTVRLEFKQLENCHSQRSIIRVIKGQSGTIITLRPIDSNKRIGFSYSYTYFNGALQKKSVKEFLSYIIPFVSGSEISIEDLYSVDSRYFGADDPENWTAFKFKSSRPDSVIASRGGVVTRITDGFEIMDTVHYTSKSNMIVIEHKDGTIANYRGFPKNRILVKVGDIVNAGEVIGLMKSEKSSGKLHFMVYYITDYDFDFEGREQFNNRRFHHRFIDPIFAHSAGVSRLEPRNSYKAVVNDELITSEMSKREKKAFYKLKQNK